MSFTTTSIARSCQFGDNSAFMPLPYFQPNISRSMQVFRVWTTLNIIDRLTEAAVAGDLIGNYYMHKIMARSSVPQQPFRSIKLALRSATIRRRATFPFLCLPAEVRNMIYDMVLNYDSVDKYFADYIAELKCGTGICGFDGPIPPGTKMTVPTILLLNREVYREAVGVLRAKPLIFTHGLIKQKLMHVINADTVRQITHLVVTDSGHEIMDRPYRKWSFGGIAKLCTDLATILKDGHSLKKLELHLARPSLGFHVAHCWDLDRGCDMRSWLVRIHKSWRQVHGIETVIVTGYMPASLKDSLVHALQLPRCHLLRLPRNVRNKIFGMAADWNDASAQLNKCNVNVVMPENGVVVTATTPTVLLLNRQFTAEALEVLHKKPLIIDCKYAEWGRDIYGAVMQFISVATLRKVTDLTIKLRHCESVARFTEMFNVLQDNHSLDVFHFQLTDEFVAQIKEAGHAYPDQQLARDLAPMTKIRGVKRAIITGDLPTCYTDGLVAHLEAPRGHRSMPFHAAYESGHIEELPDFDNSPAVSPK